MRDRKGRQGSRTSAHRRVALGIVALAAVLCAPLGAAAVAEEEPTASGGTAAAAARSSGAGATSEAPQPGGHVARAAFTTAVVDREPQDALEQLGNDVRSVSYFTELRGLAGETVTHRWELDGTVMAEVAFEVDGPRWRVHSSKRLDPTQLGVWTVSVIDSQGRVLSQQSLRYVAAGREGAPASDGE
jgi:hypothetical protein